MQTIAPPPPEAAAGAHAAAEASFRSRDGAALFYRYWAPRSPSDRALFLFHRGHEHSGRWCDFVERLGSRDAWGVFTVSLARLHGEAR